MLIAGLAYGDVHKPLTLIQGRVTPLPLNDSLVDAQAYNILDFGAKCDGTTDDTAAIQRALDAAGVTFGVVFVPSTSTGCLFTNLKLSPYTKLRGDHMRQSNLTRKAGSTGTGIREKTAGEGNAAGATGIWIQDLWIDGNSTTGDGIDIGSQNLTFQLSTMAGMSHVAVWRFSGICIKLSSNASSFEYLWADLCATGIKATGGIANTFHSVFAEFNTTNDIDLTDSNDSLFGVQIEEDRNGTNPAILVEGSDNLLEGVFIALGIDKTVLVRNAAGANRNTYRDVSIYPNGHTWTNLILDST
jgi:hypothetical protein